MAEHSASRLLPHQVFQQYQVSLVVLVGREVQGDHHGHLSHERSSQSGRGGSGCGQQQCELQGGSVSQWGEQDCGVCGCLCCNANCSSPLMWKNQCVCDVSAVEVWCTHLLPPQAAVPPPVQGTGPPSCPAHVRSAVSLSESVECVRWESLSRA